MNSNPSKYRFASTGSKKTKSRPLPAMLAALLLCALLAACSKDSTNRNEFPETDQALPVSVVRVNPVNAPRMTETVGQTEGAKEVEVRPRVGGILLKHLYEEGESVQANQALFLIDPEPFQIALAQARARLSEQQARVTDAELEEARLKRLVAENFVSQRMYDNAVASLAIERAGMGAAREQVRQAQLNLSYTKVVAPVGGSSGRAQFSEGSLVEAQNSLLTTIHQVSPVWVRFSLSDHDLTRLGGYLTEQNVQLVQVILPDGSEYPLSGKINFAASYIDPVLGTQQLRATFENPDKRLLPGQFVRVRIKTGEYQNVFVVPQPAVLASDLGKYVYVVNEQNEATIRSVQAGEWTGRDWVILDGLMSGDRVIVDNLIKLQPGLIVAPQEATDAPGHAAL
ncbi:efflux RND transporter periplasmic adaptor subunit [Nitrosomonas sp. ANs5]|uniref:efflux RND transporter periplasmic adaptor subunit n=1 Tax=Nitrosomonas sp. ANs5 TaxID=3423941 RepID=UPI003D34BAF7